jgi:glycosyltransferase involved in cell wall biosynthesis
MAAVSVIIPAYNAEPYIAETLHSVLAQSFTDLDVIVVDDGSTDHTAQIVESLVQKDGRVSLVVQPNGGVTAARNAGIAVARGEWLAFLDANDIWYPQKLERQLQSFQQSDRSVGLVYCWFALIRETSDFAGGYIAFTFCGNVTPALTYLNFIGNASAPLIRRSAIEAVGGFDIALDTGKPLPGGGDLDMFYRIIRAGHALVYEPRFLVFHQHRQTLPQLHRQYWSWGLGLMAFIVKSCQSDPTLRLQHLRLIGWWFKYQLGRLKRCLRGRYPLPPAMILVELWGGLQGLCGEYGRSQLRMKQLHQQFYAQPSPKKQFASLFLGSSLKNV